HTTYTFSRYMPPLRPRPTLFPYTPLFRSQGLAQQPVLAQRLDRHQLGVAAGDQQRHEWRRQLRVLEQRRQQVAFHVVHGHGRDRSEEHTSELQSRENLVCRLLLEKTKAYS